MHIYLTQLKTNNTNLPDYLYEHNKKTQAKKKHQIQKSKFIVEFSS